MTSSRLLPVLLLLFVGSGCAALIYEVVWFQLLELVIGSSAVSIGRPARHLHGRHVRWQSVAAAHHGGRLASAPCLCRSRAGHRRHGPRPAVRHAARRRCLYGLGGRRGRRDPVARGRCQRVPAAADASDGRHPSRDRPLGRSHAARRRVARVLLWRQYRRSGRRQSAGRLLPAPGARHGRCDLRGRGAQCRHRPHRAGGRDEGAVSAGRTRVRAGGGRARSMGRLPRPRLVRDDGAGVQKCCGRARCRCCSVPRPIPSR